MARRGTTAAARCAGVRHLVFASSSSVYGATERFPSSAHGPAEHPVNLYAATKRANELMAHAYAHQYGLPCTGLRFYTVYGPWGRPDMAPIVFSERILKGRTIDVHGHGRMRRDFTYVDDAVDAVVAALDRPAVPSPTWDGSCPDRATSSAPFRVYDVGGGRPVELLQFIGALENALGVKARIRFVEMASGEVAVTCADGSDLEHDLGVRPAVTIEEGLRHMASWYFAWLSSAKSRPEVVRTRHGTRRSLGIEAGPDGPSDGCSPLVPPAPDPSDQSRDDSGAPTIARALASSSF